MSLTEDDFKEIDARMRPLISENNNVLLGMMREEFATKDGLKNEIALVRRDMFEVFLTKTEFAEKIAEVTEDIRNTFRTQITAVQEAVLGFFVSLIRGLFPR